MSNEREEGIYWVKIDPSSRWDAMRFAVGGWWLGEVYWEEHELHAIHPERIKTPDEQSPYNSARTIIEVMDEIRAANIQFRDDDEVNN